MLESEVAPLMYVIGTAGHIDHGKSALVRALTGIDPDRLREEKERGLTIDLGFAWLKLPSGVEVSIVDVPGHERFIKNMLAGAGGIDLALLVVAADEGVMPQTREHLAILDLLGVSHGVVAVTKADLADAGLLGLAMADVREALAGTALEGAPIVPCSSVTGEGLGDLLTAIKAQLAGTPPKRDIGRPRLPIDRAFTIAGFGTVVTGTLCDGRLKVGDEVEVVPAGLRARVRGLQTHGRKVEVADPGRRTAVNLAGVPVESLRRGMVLALPGSLRPTTAVDVRLRAVGYLGRPIRHGLEVTFHTGAAEAPGRLVLLDCEAVAPGQSAWAQVRLAAPVAAVRGDRFIIRDPNDTLGGGTVADPQARRHRRYHVPTLEALKALEAGSPQDVLLLALERTGPAPLAAVVQEGGIGPAAARAAAGALAEAGRLVVLDGGELQDSSLLCTAEGLAALTARLREVLGGFHQASPLRPGMPREELRSRLGLAPRTFDSVLRFWRQEGEVRESGPLVSLPWHEPRLDPGQRARAEAYLAALRASPFAPSPSAVLDEGLLAYLETRGDIVRVADGVVFDAQAYREMVARITDYLREHGSVTLAQVRDMFGTSRKYAQALLEHLDEKRVTRRIGDERVLRGAPGA